MNRFQKRNEKRRRVFYESIKSDEEAYYDPKTKQLEVVKMKARDRKFVTPHLRKSPTFAELYKIAQGSGEEKNYLDVRMRQGKPRYEDLKTGTIIE